MKLVYRWMEPDDIRFVASSWLKSYREDGFAGGVPNDCYFNNHRRLIQGAVDRGSVLMVSPEDKLGKIVGWACYEDSANIRQLHYLYVKRGSRGSGVGGSILKSILSDDLETEYSHRTASGRGLCKSLRRLGGTYNPYAFLSRTE